MQSKTDLKPSAVVVVENQRGDCILLVHRTKAPTGWGLPGGKIEDGEDIRDAIKRELREETSLQSMRKRFIKLGESSSVNGRHVTVFKLRLVLDSDVNISSEHDGYMWVSNLNNIKLAGNTAKFLDFYFKKKKVRRKK
jgi:8-oxo-dGTP diphosphatase